MTVQRIYQVMEKEQDKKTLAYIVPTKEWIGFRLCNWWFWNLCKRWHDPQYYICITRVMARCAIMVWPTRGYQIWGVHNINLDGSGDVEEKYAHTRILLFILRNKKLREHYGEHDEDAIFSRWTTSVPTHDGFVSFGPIPTVQQRMMYPLFHLKFLLLAAPIFIHIAIYVCIYLYWAVHHQRVEVVYDLRFLLT